MVAAGGRISAPASGLSTYWGPGPVRFSVKGRDAGPGACLDFQVMPPWGDRVGPAAAREQRQCSRARVRIRFLKGACHGHPYHHDERDRLVA